MKNALVVILGLGLLAGLFVWMKPASNSPASSAPQAATAAVSGAASSTVPPMPSAPAEPVVQRIELVVKDSKLVSGPEVITVLQGSAVTLRVTTDHHDELHLHGYDLTLQLPTGQPAELSFVADRSGRFEYELHHSHLTLGALEVQPQ